MVSKQQVKEYAEELYSTEIALAKLAGSMGQVSRVKTMEECERIAFDDLNKKEQFETWQAGAV